MRNDCTGRLMKLMHSDREKKNTDDLFKKQILQKMLEGKENQAKSLEELSESYKRRAVELHNSDRFSEALPNIRCSYVADILKDYKQPLPKDEKGCKLLIDRIQNRKINLTGTGTISKTPYESVQTAKLLATEALILGNLQVQQASLSEDRRKQIAYQRLNEAKTFLQAGNREEEQKQLDNTCKLVNRLFLDFSTKTASHQLVGAPIIQGDPIRRLLTIGRHMPGVRGQGTLSLMPTSADVTKSNHKAVGQKSASEKLFLEEYLIPITPKNEKGIELLMRRKFRQETRAEDKNKEKDKNLEYIEFYYRPYFKFNSNQSLDKIIAELKQKYSNSNPKTLAANIVLLKKYAKHLERYAGKGPSTWPPELQNFISNNPNKGSQGISHYYHAYFSWKVYRAYECELKRPETSKMQEPKELEEWEQYAKSTEFLYKGEHYHYYGVAYYHSGKKTIIIAHKGTSEVVDLVADAYYALLNQMYNHFFMAKAFVEAVMQKLQQQGKRSDFFIYHTGHSLGALLAEFVACDFSQPAVTFDSPGSKRFLLQLAKKNGNATIEQTLQGYNKLITTYFAEPNFINVTDEHVGTLLRIYPYKLSVVGFQPPADHVENFQSQLPSAIFYSFALRGFTTLRGKYTLTLLLSMVMLVAPRVFSKRLLGSFRGEDIREEIVKPAVLFMTKFCFTWVCAYYAEVISNRLFKFFCRNESRNRQVDNFYTKLLFESIKKFAVIFAITRLFKVTSFYAQISLTLLFMLSTHLRYAQSKLASQLLLPLFVFVKHIIPQCFLEKDFLEKGKKILNDLPSLIGGAFGYTVGRRLLRIGQDVFANAKLLLGDSHSIKRILEIMEFSYITETPLLMSRVQSWPEGMLIGHSRVISIAQLIYQYNRSYTNDHEEDEKIYDLDDFEYDISGEKKNTAAERGKILKIYQDQIRYAIHYHAVPIRPLEEKVEPPLCNQKTPNLHVVNSSSLFKERQKYKAELKNTSIIKTIIQAKL